MHLYIIGLPYSPFLAFSGLAFSPWQAYNSGKQLVLARVRRFQGDAPPPFSRTYRLVRRRFRRPGT